jgi:serine/threonine protein kinase/Tfp pilus assembly protein PilF
MECPKCHFDNPKDTSYCGRCGTKFDSTSQISVTKTLETTTDELIRGIVFAGRYEIIEELGAGGMGKVYRAFDKKIGEEVALKLLKPEIAAEKRIVERFRNELKTARKIRHMNVCGMFDLQEEGKTLFISMEYVRGEDLKSFIHRSKQLSAGTAVSITRQIAEGLSEAHKLGIVHRDLKPHNIMIDKAGNAKIMDFGIARSLGTEGVTGEGVMIGTPEYMSPKQVEGKAADARSDLYSLGVILFEMVTGRVPFEGETPLSIAHKHRYEPAPDPQKLNPQIPVGLNRIILRCLEKTPQERYQTTVELMADLSQIEGKTPVRQRPLPIRMPLTSKEITVTLSLKKFIVPALVVIALVVAGVVVFRLLSKKEAVPAFSEKPALAIMPFKNSSGDQSLDHWSYISDLLIADLSQSRYLNIFSRDLLSHILLQLNLYASVTYSLEDFKKITQVARIDYLLEGSFDKEGDAFSISVGLREIKTGELIGVDKVKGVGEDSIFGLIDELSKRIKTIFKLPAKAIAGDIDRDLGTITTRSPEAFRFFAEGLKWYHKYDYFQSIPLMEKALAADPAFALACRYMVYSYESLGNRPESRKYFEKALQWKNRLSDKERCNLEADFYSWSKETYDKAIQANLRLLRIYPDDELGNRRLGNLYLSLEKYKEAAERYNVLVAHKSKSADVYAYLADCLMAQGLYENAKAMLDSGLAEVEDIHKRILHSHLLASYCSQGKYDLALAEMDRVYGPLKNLPLPENADICVLKGDIHRAEEEYQKLRAREFYMWDKLGALSLLLGRFEESKNQAQRGIEAAKKRGDWRQESSLRLWSADLYLKTGKPQEALAECNKILESTDSGEEMNIRIQTFFRYVRPGLLVEQDFFFRFALYFRGIACLEMNSWDKATQAAAELKVSIQKGITRDRMELYDQLKGMMELKKRNPSRAIKYFQKALSLLPAQHSTAPFVDNHALFIYSLATAYDLAGDIERAREEYQKIISLTTGRLYYGDLLAISFYRLGKIYQEKGWTAKAIEQYREFLTMWKDADPGIPELIDAKKRFAELLNR